jgi:hypothetical protein
VPGDVEDHAIGIFELALEIAVRLLAEIEKEFAAVDPLWWRTTKQAACSSTDRGGGKRRHGVNHYFLFLAAEH